MRDSLGRIVDDDGEYIGKYLIAAPENDGPDRSRPLLAVPALDAVLERYIARFDAQASRGARSCKAGAITARAGIAQLIFELQAAATARKREIAVAQAAQRGIVRLAAVALPKHGSVPFEAEPLQYALDCFGRTRDLSRPIEILDAQQPASAVGAGIEVGGSRCIQRAQVQGAGRRGREPPYIGRGAIGTGRRGRRIAFPGA